MTLLWFLLGIAIAIGIARYTKSNNIFWVAFVSLALGYAGVKLVYDSFGNENQSEMSLDQAWPTQGLPTAEDTCLCVFDNASNATPVKISSNLVSQVYTPDYIERLFTSGVSGATQGITFEILPNPPNKVPFVSDS